MYSHCFYNSNINTNDNELPVICSDSNIELIINEKKQLKEIDNNAYIWTDTLEDVLKMWGEKAAGNRELHLNSVRYWKKISEYLSIPLIFLTTITSVSTFSAVNYEDYAYWMYAAGSVNLIAAFLTSLNKYLKPEEKIQAHYQSAKNFGCFYRKLVLELSLSRSNREQTNILTKWAKEQYDTLIQDAPFVSNNVIEEYKATHETEHNTPDIIVNDFTININRND